MDEATQPIRQAADWLRVLAANDGPDLTINAHKKAAHEALELADHPSLEEMADVVICLVGTALYNGWTWAQVMGAVADKVAVNMARRWERQEDGTWQHVPLEPISR